MIHLMDNITPEQQLKEDRRKRKNAQRVELHRERMKDPEYRAKVQAGWRRWYAEKGKEKVLASVKKWRDENPMRHVFVCKKNNAIKGARHEWALEFEDIVWPTHCPALGIELDYAHGHKDGRPQDNSPSLDRIDNTRGYVKGNVVVVSGLANRIKTSATVEQIARVAAFYASLAAPLLVPQTSG